MLGSIHRRQSSDANTRRPNARPSEVRVLSYNFNVLPRGSGGYQQERIDTFLESIGSYDVLLLQEVYASSTLPYFLQKQFCFQKRLLDGLKLRGFHHYVISRQPSYYTMLQYNIAADSGLIIASRFPIQRRGSYTFRQRDRGEPMTPKGCLFAEVEVPGERAGEERRVVFFNVHLGWNDRTVADSSQIHQMRRFIECALGQVGRSGANLEATTCPFVVGGDFNVDGIDPSTGEPSKMLMDLMTELAPLGHLQDVALDHGGRILPTRPPKLFFPTQSKLERYDSVPQRQDYLFANDGVTVLSASVEKFVVSRRRPYTYLSDHFGISANLKINVGTTAATPVSPKSLRVSLASLIEDVNHEFSNPTSSFRSEYVFALVLLWLALSFSVKPLVVLGVLFCLYHLTSFTARGMVNPYEPGNVTDEAMAGREEVVWPGQPTPVLNAVETVGEMWCRSVLRYRTHRCVGVTSDLGDVEWLSYGAVDARARDLGAGLVRLGLKPGDLVGVDCEASRNALILEIACALYGFVPTALTGRGPMLLAALDAKKLRVVFASRSAITMLLNCRSTSLETIIYMHPFFDEEDQATARDLNIALMSFEQVEYDGRRTPAATPDHIAPNAPFTVTIDNASSIADLLPVSHSDVLRDMAVLMQVGILPCTYQSELMLWHTSFSHLFLRVAILGLLAQGNAVAVSEATRLQGAFDIFRPTLLVTPPSLFKASELQFHRAKKRYNPVYNWMQNRAYQLLSHLIHVTNRDSTLLRFLFFRSFKSQVGGRVRRIVLVVSSESTPFPLLEHISVCYAACTREVSYQNSVGVCTVDGISAPHIRVQLQPMDELSQKAGVGQLQVTARSRVQDSLEVAARWEKDRTLTLLGSPNGILWPVDYEYAVAVELESVFAQSRFVNDVFVFCQPRQSLVAVVYPNRDTVEFEWAQRGDSGSAANRPQLSWTELVEFATPIILAEFAAIGKEAKLHHSQIPKFLHLHPHSFKDHVTFLTPYGRLRRKDVERYFSSAIKKLVTEVDGGSSPDFGLDTFSDSESAGASDDGNVFRPQVPVTVDIGGTFAKIAFLLPPGWEDIRGATPLQVESSSLSDVLGFRTFDFFADPKMAELELQKHPHTPVGTFRFAKLPSLQVPKFAEFLQQHHVLDRFKPDCVRHIRATGGGAFKYAALARNTLNVEFDVVKEMDAVVKGLNLILQVAPESIFTFDPETGSHKPHHLVSGGADPKALGYPYLLINIGSGISFIKCLGPDGTHVRVGGTPIGGATFWGLTRTMTKLTSWEEVIEIMRLDGPGDNRNVDLLVGDIYGYNAKDLPAMLSADAVGSSFGKLGTERFYNHPTKSGPPNGGGYHGDDGSTAFTPLSPVEPNFADAAQTGQPNAIDVVKSLLHMIAGNVTQLAYLHSKVHGIQNIFFAGGFVRNNPLVWSKISATLDYWSSGQSHAHFLEHDGYLGALGCALLPDTHDGAHAPSS